MKKTLILSVIVCIFSVSASWFLLFNKKLPYSLPIEEKVQYSNTLTKIKHLFDKKKYLTLTSYVDQIFNTLDSYEQPIALFFKAESYFNIKEYILAKNSYENVIKLDDALWQAKIHLLATKILLNHPSKEIEADFQDIQRKGFEYYYWLGQYYERQKKYKAALVAYLEADPNEDKVNYAIAQMLFKSKIYDQSKSYLMKVSSNYSEYLSVLSELFVLSKRDRDIPAMNFYEEKLSSFYPQKQSLIIGVVKGYIQVGMYNKAQSILSLLGSEATLTPAIAKKLAHLNFKLKNYDQVIKYSKSFQLNFDDYIRLIQSCLVLKQYQNALLIVHKFYQKHTNLDSRIQEQMYEYEIWAYKNLREWKNAFLRATELVNINASTEHLFILASISLKMGSSYYSVALKSITSIYNRSPKQFTNIISLLDQEKSYPVRKKFLDYSLNENPKDIYALFYHAQMDLQNHSITKAKAHLFQLTDLSIHGKEMKFQVYYALGGILLQEKNYTDSLFWLYKALNIQTKINVKLKIALNLLHLHKYQRFIRTVSELKKNEHLAQLSIKELHLFSQLQEIYQKLI